MFIATLFLTNERQKKKLLKSISMWVRLYSGSCVNSIEIRLAEAKYFRHGRAGWIIPLNNLNLLKQCCIQFKSAKTWKTVGFRDELMLYLHSKNLNDYFFLTLATV